MQNLSSDSSLKLNEKDKLHASKIQSLETSLKLQKYDFIQEIKKLEFSIHQVKAQAEIESIEKNQILLGNKVIPISDGYRLAFLSLIGKS